MTRRKTKASTEPCEAGEEAGFAHSALTPPRKLGTQLLGAMVRRQAGEPSP
jgi:hypothetical protein